MVNRNVEVIFKLPIGKPDLNHIVYDIDTVRNAIDNFKHQDSSLPITIQNLAEDSDIAGIDRTRYCIGELTDMEISESNDQLLCYAKIQELGMCLAGFISTITANTNSFEDTIRVAKNVAFKSLGISINFNEADIFDVNTFTIKPGNNNTNKRKVKVRKVEDKYD